MSDRRPLPVRLFVALSRALLPAEFRRDCGREMEEAFADLYGAARAESLAAAARLLGRELYHLIHTSIRERARPERGSAPAHASTASDRHAQASSMDSFLQDIRFGIKALLKRPALTLIAAASLAIGIGANATIFAGVDIFLFRPLPFPEPERLVQIWTTNQERGWNEVSLSVLDALDYREESEALDIATYDGIELNLAGGDDPERLSGLRTSANFFRVVGYAPAFGRGFLPEEESAGQHRVAVLSRGLWERRFGRAATIVGSDIELNGVRYTVVGVMTETVPDPFREVDIWVPLGVTGEEARSSRSYLAIGRLRPGADLDEARAELAQIAARLEAAYPEANADNGVRVVPLREEMFSEDDRQAALIVGVAVGLLLIIACANVANLLLARATGREREIAVRAALGARAGRIIRQLLTESLMLGLLGGVLGLGIAALGVRWLVSIMPPQVPLAEQMGLDPRVLAFLIGISLITGLLVGILPAIRVARPDLRGSLHEGGGGRAAGRRGGRARNALAVAQIALALALVVSSTLLVRSYLNLRGRDLAYRSADVLSFRTALPEEEYEDDNAVRRFYTALLERVQALPGAATVGAISSFPSDDAYGSATYYHIEGADVEPGRWPVVNFRTATPSYFETMGLEIVEGRGFTEADREGATETVLVTRRLAERLWPGERPLGKRLVFSSATREVVGVVEDHRAYGPDGDMAEMVFFPFQQSPVRSMAILVHSAADPASLLPQIRDAVRSVDPGQPIFRVLTLEESMAVDIGGDTVMTQLMGTLAAVALLLALVGVYGVIAYSVAQRVHEMGLRMALGAAAGDVRRLVIRQGLVLGGVGIAIGLALSFAVARALSSFLWGIGSFDPPTFIGVTLLLLAAVLTASWVPARRATRVDPMIALRAE